jgi:hypothetical protein
MKKVLVLVALLVGLAGSTSLMAQNPEFSKGGLYLGPRLLLGYGVGVGVNGEYGVTNNIGVTGTVSYQGYTTGFVGYNWTYSTISIMVGGNYHFDLLKVNKLDTYAGLSIGYNIYSVTSSDSRFAYTDAAGSIGWDGRIGGRYYFSNNIAVACELGWAWLGYLRLGVDFKL